MSLILLAVGLAILIFSGTLLVDGASNVAKRHNVSPALIGLTLVAFGTSLPELAVNLAAVGEGNPALSVGNIFGSNIANLGLVLGIAVALRGFDVQSQIMRRELPLLMLVSAIATVLASDGLFRGTELMLDRTDAMVLLLLFLIFIYINFRDILTDRQDDPLMLQASTRTHVLFSRRNYAYIAVGIPGLWLGGELAVVNATALAASLGISQVIIGLTVLAIGTSLPELVTTIIATLRGQSSLALGNVVGSNLVNLLFILPVTALVRPLPVGSGSIVDICTALVFVIAVTVFAFSNNMRLSRWEGAVLAAMYFGYMGWRSLLF